MSDLYEEDIVLWSTHQAELPRRLAAGELVNDAEMNWLNIAEEIESVGRAEQDQLTNRLAILLVQRLKWRFQLDRRGNSWRLTILEQCRRVERIVSPGPSLRSRLDDILVEAYGDAVLIAARETDSPRRSSQQPAHGPSRKRCGRVFRARSLKPVRTSTVPRSRRS